jgi:hypothetical protein
MAVNPDWVGQKASDAKHLSFALRPTRSAPDSLIWHFSQVLRLFKKVRLGEGPEIWIRAVSPNGRYETGGGGGPLPELELTSLLPAKFLSL